MLFGQVKENNISFHTEFVANTYICSTLRVLDTVQHTCRLLVSSVCPHLVTVRVRQGGRGRVSHCPPSRPTSVQQHVGKTEPEAHSQSQREEEVFGEKIT